MSATFAQPAPGRLRVLIALTAAAAVLAAAGCGGGEDEAAIAELEEQLAPETDEDADEEAGDPDAEELRFDPETMACEPRKDALVSGSWQTSAPRSEVSEDTVRIGLRDTTREDEVAVKAEVTAPDGEHAEAGAALEGDAWAELEYPEDFEPEPGSLEEGVYTVVWSVDGAGARTFLSCDGFVVD